jgi:hypothetical protein
MMAHSLGAVADQIPFALSKALNDAAFATRDHLIGDVWPSAVKVRNRSFIRAALRIDLANKGKLEVSIYDALGRGHLALHAKGGVKQARGRLALPSARIRRGASGVIKSQKPINIANSFVKGDVIYQRAGRGRRKRLQLMFTLKSAASIKKDVPFIEAFHSRMTSEVIARFPVAMMSAMRTRKIR